MCFWYLTTAKKLKDEHESAHLLAELFAQRFRFQLLESPRAIDSQSVLDNPEVTATHALCWRSWDIDVLVQVFCAPFSTSLCFLGSLENLRLRCRLFGFGVCDGTTVSSVENEADVELVLTMRIPSLQTRCFHVISVVRSVVLFVFSISNAIAELSPVELILSVLCHCCVSVVSCLCLLFIWAFYIYQFFFPRCRIIYNRVYTISYNLKKNTNQFKNKFLNIIY